MSTTATASASGERTKAGIRLCTRQDLVPNSGVVAWHEGSQIAVFAIPAGASTDLELYAVDNHDPFSGANVIGRGIVGELGGELVVASPIYKQHFRLRDGQCVEDESRRLRCWPLAFDGDDVVLLQEDSIVRA
ncbi:nitrite reductase small subunit NirD [Salinicola rhizosphaerae]|uniref:Nitrite reductase small subunit n=1 Tax=Salinicola rhizosphaerae TaxID=1443141 RepID=A0ABQ3E309_9GAMM|nr:nitrite reductase small subunit NirD [Salinicola rhizosphaerae]GHB21693.1 nitrite reductase small subunit [Salinicola rhizosphaerae]